ncbi:MAG: hypothetical protein AAF986_05370 [Pseudomonadota bacterium]
MTEPRMLTCDAKALDAALSDVMRTVEWGNKVEVLWNVRLFAENGRVGVSGTNLNVTIDA